jgi:hypothetical protein
VIERDYIMRMITMLTAVIQKLLGLKRARDFPQGMTEIEKACRSLLGVDGTMLDSFSEEQLLELFARDQELAPARWFIIGVLLKERAEFRRLMGEEDIAPALELKALRFLLESYCAPDATPEPDHCAMLDTVMERIAGAALPRRSSELLALYYERVGRFGKAEDVHLDLVDEYPGHAAEVVGFYERLNVRPDQDLEAGNLPRNEVMEGLARLRNDGERKERPRG